MKWTRHGRTHRSDCGRAKIKLAHHQWWVLFEMGVAPNGIDLHPADTLKQAKAIAEGALEQADDLSGLREEAHKRLSDGERYRIALEAIRALTVGTESVDSDTVRLMVDDALRPEDENMDNDVAIVAIDHHTRIVQTISSNCPEYAQALVEEGDLLIRLPGWVVREHIRADEPVSVDELLRLAYPEAGD